MSSSKVSLLKYYLSVTGRERNLGNSTALILISDIIVKLDMARTVTCVVRMSAPFTYKV